MTAGDLQQTEVLLRHFTIPQLNHILVWAGRVSPLSTHKHPHLSLQVADSLHKDRQGSGYSVSHEHHGQTPFCPNITPFTVDMQ